MIGVVIPSIGRPDLVRAIRSSLQSDLVSKIIIVLDEGCQLGVEIAEDARIQVLHSHGLNALQKRGLGLKCMMAAENVKFIHFLDDDDYVSARFYEKGMRKFDGKSNLVAGVVARAIVVNQAGEKIREVTKTDVRHPIDFWCSNPLGTFSSALLRKSSLLQTDFDVGIQSRQDFWIWLTLSLRGYQIHAENDLELFYQDHQGARISTQGRWRVFANIVHLFRCIFLRAPEYAIATLPAQFRYIIARVIR